MEFKLYSQSPPISFLPSQQTPPAPHSAHTRAQRCLHKSTCDACVYTWKPFPLCADWHRLEPAAAAAAAAAAAVCWSATDVKGPRTGTARRRDAPQAPLKFHDSSFHRSILARMPREDATRKTVPWNLSYRDCAEAPVRPTDRRLSAVPGNAVDTAGERATAGVQLRFPSVHADRPRTDERQTDATRAPAAAAAAARLAF